jgi:hypothetical protein
MHPIYCNNPAIQKAIVDALSAHGLWPDPAAITRRPQCADTLDHQLKRITRSGAVLEAVRASVAVDEDTRHLIERLVDSASALMEREPATHCHVGLPSKSPTTHATTSPQLMTSRRATRKAVRA